MFPLVDKKNEQLAERTVVIYQCVCNSTANHKYRSDEWPNLNQILLSQESNRSADLFISTFIYFDMGRCNVGCFSF